LSLGQDAEGRVASARDDNERVNQQLKRRKEECKKEEEKNERDRQDLQKRDEELKGKEEELGLLQVLLVKKRDRLRKKINI
jgi:hypothetical protein